MKASAPKRTLIGAPILVIAATILGPFAHAQPSIRVIEKGVYQAETLARTPIQQATGVLNTVKNPRLISNTAVVYGKLGARFGVRYILVGTSQNLDVKFVIRFPPGGLRDPATSKRYFDSTQTLKIPPGAARYWEYQFENDWEIVPGVWEFEFWSGSTKLASQKFCVIDEITFDSAKTKECLPLLSGR